MHLKLLALGIVLAASYTEACVEECMCNGFKLVSDEVKDDLCTLSKYYSKCQITCKKCTPTTKSPAVTKPTKPTKATVKSPATIATKATTPATKETTKAPPSAQCGDKDAGCRHLTSHNDKDNLCSSNGYDKLCPLTCEVCSNSNKCVNFVDKNYACASRNCLDDSDRTEQNRVLVHCAKTCCSRGHLYPSDLSRDPTEQFGFHPRLLSVRD